MRWIAVPLTFFLFGLPATAQVFVGGIPRPAGFPHYRVTGFATGSPIYPWAVRPWGFFAPVPILIVPQPVLIVPVANGLPGLIAPEPPPAEVRPAANWLVIRPEKVPAFPIVARPDLNPAAPPAAAGDRNANPKLEAARQLRLAQAAFTADEYGRAVERLNEAIKVRPDEPLSYFLLAQVRFARGEYAEAVAGIHDGLKLAPDWPASAFTPKPLYAVPAKFDAHLNDLRAAIADQPDDVTLQFLLAHQLWFTGGRDEARKIFRRLLPLLKEKTLVEAYLNVADARLVKK
ncbi:tetratricopeptide repeat protein [Limnoglobus roseus]|uniref:Tetratricopeptide repeat protein n=1 Tax=Limnoglobus roseus TaxID=2598579 RepID=A0A5C1AM44_9BACT|nr:tetratricopeptide repeat protein [Limnoglobus roseus]QEL19036.1 tetratricopeptide repeat protein [Limnoglobus roseus]